LVYPLDTKAGINAMAITSSGTIAHKISHNIGLRPFALAKIAPAMPATTIRMRYLINGFLYVIVA